MTKLGLQANFVSLCIGKWINILDSKISAKKLPSYDVITVLKHIRARQVWKTIRHSSKSIFKIQVYNYKGDVMRFCYKPVKMPFMSDCCCHGNCLNKLPNREKLHFDRVCEWALSWQKEKEPERFEENRTKMTSVFVVERNRRQNLKILKSRFCMRNKLLQWDYLFTYAQR